MTAEILKFPKRELPPEQRAHLIQIMADKTIQATRLLDEVEEMAEFLGEEL